MLDLDTAIRVVLEGGVQVRQLDEGRWLLSFPAGQPEITGVIGSSYLLRLAQRLTSRSAHPREEHDVLIVA